MSNGPGILRKLIQDLQRRNVFRAGAIYAVVAWSITEAGSVALPAFGDTGFWLRLLIVVAIAGFPIVLTLAWLFEVGPEGVEVTADTDAPRHPRRKAWVKPVVATLVVAGVVGSSVWLWTSRLAHQGDTEFTQQTRPDELPIVAVLPLENLTGRKELDWSGAGIATLIRDDLAQSRYLAVVGAARTLRLRRESPDLEQLFQAALDAGITHVLTGEILRTPKGLTLTTRITDLRRNVEIGANRRESLQPEELIGTAPSITSLVKQGLGVPGTEKVDVFATDFATRNLPAYEAFIVGMENFLAFNYEGAKDLFQVAVQKAPDFAMARYRLAHSLAALGETTAALEQVRLAKDQGVRLPALEQAYIAAGERYFSRDYAEAEKLYRSILADHPYETEARALLLYVLVDQGNVSQNPSRYEAALVEGEALVQQDAGDETAWSSVADLNIRLRRYDAADEALARLLKLAPQNPNALYLAGESQFYRRNYDAAAKRYEEALAADAAFGEAAQRLAHADVLQGRTAAAITRLRAMASSPTMPVSHRTTAALDLAYLLRAERRPAEAMAALEERAADFTTEGITESLSLAVRAQCLMDLGRNSEAVRVAGESVGKFPARLTRYLLVRGLAEIAAKDYAALEVTSKALLAQPARDDPTDLTERKAVDYLAGVAALARGDAAAAVPLLRAAIQAKGRAYDAYEVALAKALAATGDRTGARTALAVVVGGTEPSGYSLEGEYARREARTLLASLR